MGRAWLIWWLLTSAGCSPQQPSPIAKAAAYLWRQQSADGGWHSHTYGLLRSGQSLTRFDPILL
jgi:hypothetical protein